MGFINVSAENSCISWSESRLWCVCAGCNRITQTFNTSIAHLLILPVLSPSLVASLFSSLQGLGAAEAVQEGLSLKDQSRPFLAFHWNFLNCLQCFGGWTLSLSDLGTFSMQLIQGGVSWRRARREKGNRMERVATLLSAPLRSQQAFLNKAQMRIQATVPVPCSYVEWLHACWWGFKCTTCDK